MNIILEIEKPLLDLEQKIKELKKVNLLGKIDLTSEIKALEKKAGELKRNIYGNLSAWDKVQLARHPLRPNTSDYIRAIFTDFTELHGDRFFADDAAIIGGPAKLNQKSVMIIGHQKGKDTKENLLRNFGMANPEGFRKAARLMKLAEKFRFPVISFIDTPGAYPGIAAEEHGQFEAIARNLFFMSTLQTPIIVVVIGEGGSGGALGIGVGDYVLMLENSIYSVISPEGCASILWRDASKAPKAAEALKLTADNLLEMKIIDEILPEPLGGVHRDSEVVYIAMKNKLLSLIDRFSKLKTEDLVNKRYDKFRKIGVFTENAKVHS